MLRSRSMLNLRSIARSSVEPIALFQLGLLGEDGRRHCVSTFLQTSQGAKRRMQRSGVLSVDQPQPTAGVGTTDVRMDSVVANGLGSTLEQANHWVAYSTGLGAGVQPQWRIWRARRQRH